jgi:protein-disulfide isomerase
MAKDRVETGRGRRSGVVKGTKKSSANTAFYLLIGVVAIGGIAALTYLSTRNRSAQANVVDPSLPPVQSAGYVLGNPAAPLEVVEFADFECPACERFYTLTEPDVRARLVNTGQVRVRFIDYPLSMHRNTWNASRAAACADEQGKFWEMHDVIYANQDRWNGEATSNPDRVLTGLARQIKLDMGKFEECVESRRTQAKIQAHLRLAEERRIPSTPTFIFGDRQVAGALSYDNFKQMVDEAIARGARNTRFGDSTKAAAAGDTARGASTAGDSSKAATPR